MNELWRIDHKSDVVEKWVPKDRFDVLLALAYDYQLSCAECNGTGTVDRKAWPGGIEVDYDKPCDDCADIRAAIAKATQP